MTALTTLLAHLCDVGLYAVHTQECIERAAEKTGHRLEYATRLGRTSTSRLANGTIVVPRAAELDTHVMQSLPAAMQFEVLEEIQNAENVPENVPEGEEISPGIPAPLPIGNEMQSVLSLSRK